MKLFRKNFDHDGKHKPNAVYRNSHKRKDTYNLKIDGTFINYAVFGDCRGTPLSVISVNGTTQVEQAAGYMDTVRFPNPGANEMAINFQKFKHIFGDVIASTVIQYKDKVTNKPVLTLFPHMVDSIYEDMDVALSHLNRATRKDFLFQLQLRSNKLKRFQR